MRLFKVLITTPVFIECDTFVNAEEFARKYIKNYYSMKEADLAEMVDNYPRAKLFKVESFRSIDGKSHEEKEKAHLHATVEACKVKEKYRSIRHRK